MTPADDGPPAPALALHAIAPTLFSIRGPAAAGRE
jgi:hypothetical protein